MTKEVKDLNSMFRPSKWQDIKGQDIIVNLLKNQSLTKKGLSNAYLFCGKSGVGKTTLARLFFRCLNSEIDAQGNPKTNGELYDLIEVNASDTRGIDDMRELIKSAEYSPIGQCKGILLDEAHMLTAPAWNCLLKPIENLQKSFWFFATTDITKVPKTIQTRCQIIKLNPIRWSDTFNRLKEIALDVKIDITESDLWTIARNSDNNLRQAIHLLEQYSVTKDIKAIIASEEVNEAFLQALIEDDISKIWQVLMSWQTKYQDMDVFLNSVKHDLSSTLKIKLGLPMQMNPYALKKYQDFAEKLSEDKIIKMLDILLKIQEKITGIYDYNSLFLKGLCQYKNFSVPPIDK